MQCNVRSKIKLSAAAKKETTTTVRRQKVDGRHFSLHHEKLSTCAGCGGGLGAMNANFDKEKLSAAAARAMQI